MRNDAEKDGDDRALARAFSRVIADLAQGGLTFPPPFDFASSLALASNLDCGELAQQLFTVTAARETQFRVSIEARSAEHPGLSRQVVDTTVNSTPLLAALLEGVLEELYAKTLDN